MTRSKAIDRVRKLRALAADRAATGPEKALARQHADKLIARFDLSESEVAPGPIRRRPVPQPQPGWPFSATTNAVWGGTVNTTFPFRYGN